VVDAILQSAIKASGSLGCILCGRETKHVGVFTPDRGSDYDVPPSGRFVYRICDDQLVERPEVKARIERQIWKLQRTRSEGTRS
jgi:hypothetical protein